MKLANKKTSTRSRPDEAPGPSTHEEPWRFNHRLIAEHLGSLKYSSASRALGELIANALDAGATSVFVDLQRNELESLQSFRIRDNGRGMSPDVLKERFVEVGVVGLALSADRIGRLGVGRLAVHRLGSKSEWSSVSIDPTGAKTRINFSLHAGAEPSLKYEVEQVDQSHPTGTTVNIFNVRDTGTPYQLYVAKLRLDLTAQFCGYLLAHPDKRIVVDGEGLDVLKLVLHQKVEPLHGTAETPFDGRIRHLVLNRPIDPSRSNEGQVLFSLAGQTVHVEPVPDLPNTYIGIVECPQIGDLVAANRTSLLEFDPLFVLLRRVAVERVAAFTQTYLADLKSTFIVRARQQPFYPFRNVGGDPIRAVEQTVYDVALEALNDHAPVERMSQKHQQMVFRLLLRAISNQDLLHVLKDVADLSDKDLERFRRVLERTTLESIIRLSSEVTSRLQFLDVLHEVVYGDSSKRVKERSQLHKLLEPNGWIFGVQYHLATSDKAFREVVRRHRAEAGLEPSPDEVLQRVKGLSDIPDLFLAAQREYPIEPRHHHLLVEIKAPRVTLGNKEREQIRRYAETILSSPQFDKRSTQWDLFLISAQANGEIERDRNQAAAPSGRLYLWQGMTVWARLWSEIISDARAELQLIRAHLETKSSELSLSSFLATEYPQLFPPAEKPSQD